MIEWTPKELEAILGCVFDYPDKIGNLYSHVARFGLGGIQYCLTIFEANELVWLSADTTNPEQATPQFEFSLRCDRIRTGIGRTSTQGGIVTPTARSIFFDFSDGEEGEYEGKHRRLTIERIIGGDFYVWPIIGASDPHLNYSSSEENS